MFRSLSPNWTKWDMAKPLFSIMEIAHITESLWRRACHVRVPCGTPASGVAVVMPPPDYAGYRFPSDVILRAVWMYLRFTLSYRDVEDLLGERGVEVSYETIRRWVTTFGPVIAHRLRARRPVPHRRWHLDEMFVRIGGKQMYLWRAVDAEGEVLEVLVQARRDAVAARKLMRKLLRKQGIAPTAWVTDTCPAYGAALRDLRLDGIPHLRAKRQTTGPRARTLRFDDASGSDKDSSRPLRRSGSCQCMPRPTTFNVCRHLTTARTHRLFRAEAFAAWRDAAGVAA
jgi:putative transposase